MLIGGISVPDDFWAVLLNIVCKVFQDFELLIDFCVHDMCSLFIIRWYVTGKSYPITKALGNSIGKLFIAIAIQNKIVRGKRI